MYYIDIEISEMITILQYRFIGTSCAFLLFSHSVISFTPVK